MYFKQDLGVRLLIAGLRGTTFAPCILIQLGLPRRGTDSERSALLQRPGSRQAHKARMSSSSSHPAPYKLFELSPQSAPFFERNLRAESHVRKESAIFLTQLRTLLPDLVNYFIFFFHCLCKSQKLVVVFFLRW